MITMERARQLRGLIETAAVSLDDAQASQGAELYPRLREDGSLVKAGARINWGGVVKKAAADLWDTRENNPDNAPDLWAELDYHNGYRIIPEVITVTLAFGKDEIGWWRADGLYYQAVRDGVVHTPAEYPDDWIVAEV